MEVSQLSSFILGIGIAAIIGAVVIVILDQMAGITGLGTAPVSALGNATSALSSIFTDWYGLVVLAGIAGIVIYLVITGIAGAGKR